MNSRNLAGADKDRNDGDTSSRFPKYELKIGIARKQRAEAAQARSAVLEEQLESSRAEADRRLTAARSEFDQRLAELQASMAAQEKTFHTEVDRATARLEGVQKQVMAQVAEARETARQTEMLLTNARQKNDELSVEVQNPKAQLGSKAQEHERAQSDLAKMAEKADRLQAERESMLGEVALLTGKIGAQTAQIESLERRAVNAETRLERALQQSSAAEAEMGLPQPRFQSPFKHPSGSMTTTTRA